MITALAALLVSCGLFGRRAEQETVDADTPTVEAAVAAENAVTDAADEADDDDEPVAADADYRIDVPDTVGMSAERRAAFDQALATMRDFAELDGWWPYNASDGEFALRGNFFGDRNDDVAVLAQNEVTGWVRIYVLNRGRHGVVEVAFGEDDPGGDDYSWVGVFSLIAAGEPIWSNWDDEAGDFRNLEDVPQDEIVELDYDAFLVHMAEACGGGIIFWKDGKFNWQQQE